ncbi:MAG: GIY-YIG nuclease family protein [Stellaceae bacterium]
MESSKPGCYALYYDDGDLLYIGKSSNAVGFRLWNHFKQSKANWVMSVSFVQIVEVQEPFEAPSLEEYLIRELRPPCNHRGIKRKGQGSSIS